MIQETKLKRNFQCTIQGRRCFHTISGDNGGVLMIACLWSLKSALIHKEDKECEVLIVKVELEEKDLRILVG